MTLVHLKPVQGKQFFRTQSLDIHMLRYAFQTSAANCPNVTFCFTIARFFFIFSGDAAVHGEHELHGLVGYVRILPEDSRDPQDVVEF